MTKQNEKQYIVVAILLAIILTLSFIVIPILPAIIVLDIIIGVTIFLVIRKISSIQKHNKQVKKMEEQIYNRGYEKICDGFFINEKEHSLNLQGTYLGFSQIIDCELMENKQQVSQIYQTSSTTHTHTMKEYCTELYINITIENLDNPTIKLDFMEYMSAILIGSKKYNKILEQANHAMATLKVIISKANEQYINKGRVTKIEHRYINEKTPEEKLKEITKLYEKGFLTEYEYGIKKKELLDKIK